MIKTIGRLLEVLVERPVRSESEIAQLLELDFVALRARLLDLKKRGILTGPFPDGLTTTWASWYSTPAAAMEAAERSGLRSGSPILLRRSWWNEMWAA